MADEAKRNFKIWRASPSSDAGIMITPRGATIAGNAKNAVVADETGVYLSMGGSVSFGTTSENIRMGGLFVQMNDWIRMIPQSMMTPFPNGIPSIPLSLGISSAKELAVVIAMLA